MRSSDRNTLPKLIGDSRRFLQVLINLVKNAVKFTKYGSVKIKASYSNQTSLLIVRIEDTGTGIAK